MVLATQRVHCLDQHSRIFRIHVRVNAMPQIEYMPTALSKAGEHLGYTRAHPIWRGM